MAHRKPREWEREFPDSAPAILKVLTTYKEFTKRNNFRYGREYCLKLKDVSQQSIIQALSIYHKKAELDKQAPHPNYFIATCLSLNKGIQSGVDKDGDEPLIILGRMI